MRGAAGGGRDFCQMVMWRRRFTMGACQAQRGPWSGLNEMCTKRIALFSEEGRESLPLAGESVLSSSHPDPHPPKENMGAAVSLGRREGDLICLWSSKDGQRQQPERALPTRMIFCLAALAWARHPWTKVSRFFRAGVDPGGWDESRCEGHSTIATVHRRPGILNRTPVTVH